MAEGKRFTMPSDQPGPRCIFKNAAGVVCGALLNSVYRTERKDRYVFRQHICPACGRKNTTMAKVIEIID